MQLNPYIYFNGRCQEALDFYEGALGAKAVFKMTYGESPEAEKCAKESLDKIMHARLDVGGSVIMMSDAPEGHYSAPQGFCISLNLQDPMESEEVYRTLSAGGKVQMPIAETFWAQRFAMFTDKFGTPWMINCEKTQ